MPSSRRTDGSTLVKRPSSDADRHSPGLRRQNAPGFQLCCLYCSFDTLRNLEVRWLAAIRFLRRSAALLRNLDDDHITGAVESQSGVLGEDVAGLVFGDDLVS